MNRHQMRLGLVFSVYQHLLLKKNLFAQAEENLGGELEEEERIYASEVLNDIEQQETNYIYDISLKLNNWHFDRLNYVAQAILLVGISELRLHKIDKAIVVDEAVRMAKEYCEEDSFKYINGVLDCL